MNIFNLDIHWDNIDEDKKKEIFGIIAGSLIMAFLINYFFFKLYFELSFIYDIILLIILVTQLFCDKDEKYGNVYDKIAIALMAESVIISFNDFDYTIESFFFFKKTVNVSIAPNMPTILISILFFTSIWVRNDMELNLGKPIDLIMLTMLILVILFFASLMSVLVSNDYFYIPLIGETNYSAQSLFIIFLAFSWVGIKCVSMIIILIMVFLSVGRIGEVNRAMGIAGIFYLLFAYIAIILIIRNEKIKNKIKYTFHCFKNDFFYKNDIDEGYKLLQ